MMIDLAFVFSPPAADNDLLTIKNFIKQFITLYLPINSTAVRVSVTTFDASSATVVFLLNAYTNEEDLNQAIDAIMTLSSVVNNPAFGLEVRHTHIILKKIKKKSCNFTRQRTKKLFSL